MLDTSMKRALKFESRFKLHRGRQFSLAKTLLSRPIPLKGLKSLSYVVVDLNVKQTAKLTLYVSHTELRMQMDPLQPVQLYSQFDPQALKSSMRCETF